MIARCMVIAPNRHPVKIKAKDYKQFLDTDYDTFFVATHLWGTVRGDQFNYFYAISRKHDTKKTRLNYIDYLVNKKGFNV